MVSTPLKNTSQNENPSPNRGENKKYLKPPPRNLLIPKKSPTIFPKENRHFCIFLVDIFPPRFWLPWHSWDWKSLWPKRRTIPGVNPMGRWGGFLCMSLGAEKKGTYREGGRIRKKDNINIFYTRTLQGVPNGWERVPLSNPLGNIFID